MDIIGIIYDILDVNLVSRDMLGDVVNISSIIMPYMGYIALFGLLVGFYVYRRYMRYYNRDIYKIKGKLYYKVNGMDARAYFLKNNKGKLYTTGRWLYERSHCFDCAFIEPYNSALTCRFLKDHNKCPLRGKGYFIEIGNGL